MVQAVAVSVIGAVPPRCSCVASPAKASVAEVTCCWMAGSTTLPPVLNWAMARLWSVRETARVLCWVVVARAAATMSSPTRCIWSEASIARPSTVVAANRRASTRSSSTSPTAPGSSTSTAMIEE